jgi:hypothetical protein
MARKRSIVVGPSSNTVQQPGEKGVVLNPTGTDVPVF